MFPRLQPTSFSSTTALFPCIIYIKIMVIRSTGQKQRVTYAFSRAKKYASFLRLSFIIPSNKNNIYYTRITN